MSSNNLNTKSNTVTTFQLESGHLTELIENLRQYMFTKDLSGAFTYCNNNFASLYGLSPNEMVGKTDADFFDQKHVSAIREVDIYVQESGEDWSGEETFPFPAAGLRTVSVNKSPLRKGESGNIIGIAGIFVDITENAKIKNQNFSTKTNGLVHEILIPLAAISSNLENLIRHFEGKLSLSDGEKLEFAKFAHSQVHILGLHSENIQKALLGESEMPYVFSRHSIKGVISECMSVLESTAEKKNVRFTRPKLDNKFSGSFPNLEMSHPDLTRAIKNLYHNAVKYSYSGTKLTTDSGSPHLYRWIDTRVFYVDKNYFEMSISNYGPGILEDEIKHIFDEGVRGALSIDRHRTGSGLGLSQVKKIIERHGGTVRISSEKKGGPWLTVVTVYLPYKQSKGALRYDQDLEALMG